MLLPKKVGSFTLMRKLDADGLSESFVAILDDPAGKQVVARRILPVVARDTGRIAHLRARVGDLRAARHASLVPVVDLVEGDGDLYVLEDWSDGIELSAVVQHCITHRTTVPHNVYLNLATQVCNALEALHGRPGTESGSENVLHLALAPAAMWVASDGRVTVGRYGLARSPTAIATAATGALPAGVEYLAPEQTHQDQKLTPASDIFSLGAILYELLTLKPMFRADSSLQTIHRVRRAEVTTQLLEVKEIMPGLDKVLFRALSLNPRHRYQRAFVLREDLRGLMAGYSFNDIDTVTRAFLAPIVRAKAEQGAGDEPVPAFANTDPSGDTTGFLLGHAAGSFAKVPPNGDPDTDATDSLLHDPDSDIEAANTDRNAVYDPEEADTAQNVRQELRSAFNTDDSALRAPVVEPRIDVRSRTRAERTDAGRTDSGLDSPHTDSGFTDFGNLVDSNTNTDGFTDGGEKTGEKTRWVPAKPQPDPAVTAKRPISSVDTGWSRIPSGNDDDRVAVPPMPQPEPLGRAFSATGRPLTSSTNFEDVRDPDTGFSENTIGLLEPTTGPLPSGSDTFELGDPETAPRRHPAPQEYPASQERVGSTSAADTRANQKSPGSANKTLIPVTMPGQPGDSAPKADQPTRPAPRSAGEPDTIPNAQQPTIPLREPETLEVNVDTDKVDHPGIEGRLATGNVTRPETRSAPGRAVASTSPVPAPNAADDRNERGRPSSVTTWTDRADDPRPNVASKASTETTRKQPSRDPQSRTVEVEEPWSDVPTSPAMSDSQGFQSDTYEAIPTADLPVSGMTGSIPRPLPLEQTTQVQAARESGVRQRYQQSREMESPAVTDDDDAPPQRSFLPIAAVVLAGAVFLAVCAGIGGGGVLSWIATSGGGGGGLVATDLPSEPVQIAAAEIPPEPDTLPATADAGAEQAARAEQAKAVALAEQAKAVALAERAKAETEAQQARAVQERAEQERAAQARLEQERAEREKAARIAAAAKPAPVAPKPVPVAPKPVPVAPKPTPVAVAPRPAPVAPPPRPAPAPRIQAPPPQPAAETWDAVADAEVAAAASATSFAIPTTELDRWSDAAFAGELSPSAISQLEAVPKTDPGYTRARTLMYLDAKAREDVGARDEHLAAMMGLPENRYNPILLVESAQIAIDKKDWQGALKSAQTAEQHWARLPSDLVFTRKSMIYEIQALAQTGMFYGSDSEDRERLSLAIRGWERYRSHVQTKSRADLVARADEHLEQLNEIQRRLE